MKFIRFLAFLALLYPSKYIFSESINSKSKFILIGRHSEFTRGLKDDGTYWSYIYTSDSILFLNNSDLYRISTRVPSVLSMDLGEGVLNDKNSFAINSLIDCVKAYYNKTHGLVTFSYHVSNPWWVWKQGTVASYRYQSPDHPNVVREILNGKVLLTNGQTVRSWYEDRLSEVIKILSSLKDSNGRQIPFVFRPFHEGSGSWFWWGHSQCSNEEYKQLFRLTIDKLRLHFPKMRIVYSPDSNWNTLDKSDKYMDRYPGDSYVDILGMDNYSICDEESKQKSISQLRQLTTYAKVHHKLVALTEVGNLGLTVKKWFTDYLYPTLTASGVNVSYVVFWGSWSKNKGYCIPFKKKSLENKDFIKFLKKKQIKTFKLK